MASSIITHGHNGKIITVRIKAASGNDQPERGKIVQGKLCGLPVAGAVDTGQRSRRPPSIGDGRGNLYSRLAFRLALLLCGLFSDLSIL